MSQENDKASLADVHASEGIHTQEAPFERGYQPESLPKISIPDLSQDAQGLTAEALAQVPTLTESLDEAPGQALLDVSEVRPDTPVVTNVQVIEPAEPIQDTSVQADTWVEELHVRMGKLTGDIHTLNARLDRLEERNKTKV
jgi:hypothetical protein